MKNKSYNRNPEGHNQWILRSNDEIQKIIDKHPTWTKKDFRGEGKLNPNKKRSNCSECDIDRNFNYLNNMNSLEKKTFYKNIYKNLNEQQLVNKRKRQKKYYYETFKNDL